MFKFIVPVCLSLAILSPSNSNGQDCGCDNNGIGSGDYAIEGDGNGFESGGCGSECVKTRKKLALIESSIQIKRLRRVCETDECGCSRNRLALVSEPLSFKRLGLVDVPVDPCRPKILERMRQRMASLGGNRGGGGCDSGCDSGFDSGCESCGNGSYDQGNYGGEIIGADCGSDGVSMSYGNSMPVESNNFIESAPRITTPRATDVLPRNVQPRNVIDTTPRANSSIIEDHAG